jgi:hypothetical protein
MRFLLLAVLASACASSPLIRPGDTEFLRAQDRLAATQQRVLALVGPGPESASFLQAESLYRDRFALRLHGAGSYVAQAAAAAIDFGPLSVLAAGNGMADFRLMGYDGAAQLYEAQLARFPQGKLAPLAQYRLGWAYRSVSLDWPRSSEQSFKAAETAGIALAAQAAKVPWKSQETAVTLSILPGLGQIYTGETGNGVVRMALAVAFLALAVVPAVVALKDHDASWQRVALSTAGLVGLQVVYTTAYQDAQRAALEFNEREEAKFEDAHPESP